MNKSTYGILIFLLSLNTLSNELLSIDTASTSLNVVESQPLHFGVIYVDPSQEGVVSLNLDGEISATTHSPSGAHKVGEYTLSGVANSTVSVSIDANEGKLSSNGLDLPVTYVLNTPSVILNEEGVAAVKVAGTLTIPAEISEGIYSGGFTLIASY